MTIKRVKNGYVLVSKTTGRRLSKVLKSRKSLEKREKQIIWFKNQKKYRKDHRGRSIPGTRKKKR